MTLMFHFSICGRKNKTKASNKLLGFLGREG